MGNRFIHVLVCLVTIALAGCGPAVRNLTVRSTTPISANEGMATVVVIQPTTRFGSLNLLDGEGRLVGQLNDRSHTLIRVPAGALRLYAVPERQGSWGDRIEGTLEAGKVYYATIGMRWGGLNIVALNPRSADNRWAERERYIQSTPMVEMDNAQVSLAVAELGNTRELLDAVDRTVGRYDEAHREERTIRADDGL